EDAVAPGERDPGRDRDAENAPPNRAPAPAEVMQDARALLALQPLHRRHGDEDERHRPADPDDGGEQVHDAKRGIHPPGSYVSSTGSSSRTCSPPPNSTARTTCRRPFSVTSSPASGSVSRTSRPVATRLPAS